MTLEREGIQQERKQLAVTGRAFSLNIEIEKKISLTQSRDSPDKIRLHRPHEVDGSTVDRAEQCWCSVNWPQTISRLPSCMNNRSAAFHQKGISITSFKRQTKTSSEREVRNPSTHVACRGLSSDV